MGATVHARATGPDDPLDAALRLTVQLFQSLPVRGGVNEAEPFLVYWLVTQEREVIKRPYRRRPPGDRFFKKAVVLVTGGLMGPFMAASSSPLTGTNRPGERGRSLSLRPDRRHEGSRKCRRALAAEEPVLAAGEACRTRQAPQGPGREDPTVHTAVVS